MSLAVSPAEIVAAAGRISGHVLVTPLIENAALNARVGGRVLLKAEVLQHTGSFKVRGAFNRLLQIPPAERPYGVVAFSSGNHAQAVAYAARALSMPAAIVMPSDAPAVKLAATRDLGAEVVLYDRAREDREAIAGALAAARRAALVPSYDDAAIIAGQGTLGREALRQAEALSSLPDLVLVPVSGGGLIGGIAIALHARCPEAQIIACEPAGFDDFGRSLAAGRIVDNTARSGSLLDALLAPAPGRLTFPIAQAHHLAAMTVSDDEALAAMRVAATTLKLVVEPGGAAGLAALLSGRLDLAGRTALVVLSGGNVDPDLLVRALLRPG